jgi:hypothetical protein
MPCHTVHWATAGLKPRRLGLFVARLEAVPFFEAKWAEFSA